MVARVLLGDSEEALGESSAPPLPLYGSSEGLFLAKVQKPSKWRGAEKDRGKERKRLRRGWWGEGLGVEGEWILALALGHFMERNTQHLQCCPHLGN